MKKLLQKRLNNEKGLTLVELLAVIVILGIIAAIAVPSIGGVIENSRVKAMQADALNVLTASDLYFVDETPTTSTKTVTVTKLKTDGFLDDLGSFEGDSTATDNYIVTYDKDGNTFVGDAKSGTTTLKFNGATKKSINKATKVKSGSTITGTTVTPPQPNN